RKQPAGARVLLKSVEDPERFGVAEVKDGKILGIVEKPKNPKSSYAVMGLYMYDSRVFDVIRTLKPSKRGELEITDVNNYYLREGQLEYDMVKGYWTDAGTFESLYRANRLTYEKKCRMMKKTAIQGEPAVASKKTRVVRKAGKGNTAP
ncbi:MAG: sugar phosphate nucleotidyltransferase, partial [Candidatus Omnitrophica bacterium]|nr:sugar phosphate nucleotidyltransferase [Candidatus Omnitrophota bacterium]